ncbi:MAG: SurA N-terminal domain-containing protein [Acidobacteria bacterium]|nr:SurA N-terminal domain-containing protein [Acidobacteriota bacterium]
MTRTKKIFSQRMLAAGCAAAMLLSLAGCKKEHSADVVASVNGKAIQRAELDKLYQDQLRQNPQQDVSEDQADAARLSILRQMIDEEIIQQRAAKMNLTASNEDVDAKIAEMKAPYTQEQFDARLKASNHSLEDLKREVRRSLTFDKLLNKEINSKIAITDADVSNYYAKHKGEYNLIEAHYHLAQVLVTGMPAAQAGNLQGSKAANDAEAKKKIQMLKNRLDSGEDFSAIAMNFSENPQTAQNGGDMGFIPESQLRTDPMVFAAVSKLKAGQITDIVPVYDNPGASNRRVVGYAILKLISREPPGQRSLQDPAVQQNIRQQLQDARSTLLKNAYFEMLRNQAKVENYLAEDIFKRGAK